MKTVLLFVAALGGSMAVGATITPVADKVTCRVADRQDCQVPDRVQLSGWLGSRIAANEANRLAKLDADRLLEGYRKRPGRQSWDGEHVGKWLHAATLAWVNTGDAALRRKLDHVVAELCKCQLPDGYLGTYLDKDRWTSWDVWAHKYNLIGLTTYIRFTGNQAPMATCRRMADLLCNTFGDQPGRRDIIRAGSHVGMAPTSVLEPMVVLYRMTGEPRYLEFCEYILRAWEQPNGPHIVSRLLDVKRVDKVGNGKAYEMLSCLNGALEYYRTVGDRRILDACLNAWQDIVAHRLYLTGTASYHELFHDNFDLPNTGNVGETCVTVTWLQFNAQLLRLTGEARFAEQLERVALNQLIGAQCPDGTAWGYYVEMEGRKPYSSTLDGHCCLSSGPRGLALIPSFAVTADAQGPVVNLYDACKASLTLRDGTAVRLAIETLYPGEPDVCIKLDPPRQQRFAVKLRIPAWCPAATIEVNGNKAEAKSCEGYAVLDRAWSPGDAIRLQLKLEPRVVVGDHLQHGKVAVLYGPLVLAADEALIPPGIASLGRIAAAGADLAALKVQPQPAPEKLKTWPGAQVFRINTVARRTAGAAQAGEKLETCLVPFADAGAGRTRYKVWLPLPGQAGTSLLAEGKESRSRPGNLQGTILDEPPSPVVTWNSKPADKDWYAVTLDKPVAIARVAFQHGRTFHDGGWFDASAGKPRVEVQRQKAGAWQTIGTLEKYPATTATDSKRLRDGKEFTLQLSQPATVYGVRVIGRPACGDRPGQAFSSCGGLQAFEK